MQLRLSELREVAEKAMNDRKVSDALCAEIKREFGATADIGSDVAALVERANYVLDVVERRGHVFNGKLDERVLRAAMKHRNADVRKLAARLLPLNEVKSLVFDSEGTVRHAAARRLPARVIVESLKLNVDDDELNLIYQTKKLEEAAAKEQKTRLTGDAVKQQDYPALSDGYYESMANKFISDYGISWQQNWPLLVKRYVSSTKATSGVEIDEKKLFEAIKEIVDEREEEALNGTQFNAIRETIDYLNSQMEKFDESVDVLDELIHSGLGAADFVEKVSDVYSVKESYLPSAIKKYRLGESDTSVTMIPQKARTPHGKPVTQRDEVIMDRFVESWNKRQALSDEPIKLDWYIHPMDAATIGFKVSLI